MIIQRVEVYEVLHHNQQIWQIIIAFPYLVLFDLFLFSPLKKFMHEKHFSSSDKVKAIVDEDFNDHPETKEMEFIN